MSRLWATLTTARRVIRYKNYSRFVRNKVASKNPGLDRTLQLMKDENATLDRDEIEDFVSFDESEPDFTELHKMHRKHEKESGDYKRNIRRKIVEDKYFDLTYPNLLTWSEKEQIRYLHASDPEAWTVQRLSESFPATEEIIAKIIKVDWKPSNEKRIARHDAGVVRNWKQLQEGELQGITPEMRERFLKFAGRVISPRLPADLQETVRISLDSGPPGEYASLVAGPASADRPEKPSTADQESRLKYLTPPKPIESYSRSSVTLDELMSVSEFANEVDRQYSVSDTVTSPPGIEKVEAEERAVSHWSPRIDAAAALKPLDYPQKITIPKKHWKKGGTYKVNDCYYDDDGLFLYRVPGMS